MGAVGAYIFSVSAAALLCGMVSGLLEGCCIQKYAQFICALILLVMVLRPITSCGNADITKMPELTFPDGESLISDSIYHANQSMKDIIKQETQAYIVDKASLLGLDIQVEVILSDESVPVPWMVTLSGKASPYSRLKLEQIIQEELNISKENLTWNG